jgi:hypothetical protein
MERVKGIEPSSQAWEARILPLNHTRICAMHLNNPIAHGKTSYSGNMLISTLSAAVLPAGRVTRFSATLPDSTQTIF